MNEIVFAYVGAKPVSQCLDERGVHLVPALNPQGVRDRKVKRLGRRPGAARKHLLELGEDFDQAVARSRVSQRRFNLVACDSRSARLAHRERSGNAVRGEEEFPSIRRQLSVERRRQHCRRGAFSARSAFAPPGKRVPGAQGRHHAFFPLSPGLECRRTEW